MLLWILEQKSRKWNRQAEDITKQDGGFPPSTAGCGAGVRHLKKIKNICEKYAFLSYNEDIKRIRRKKDKMYEFEDMDMIGFKSEEHAKAMAAEAMKEALAAGYDPSKKPFTFKDGDKDNEEEKKPGE